MMSMYSSLFTLCLFYWTIPTTARQIKSISPNRIPTSGNVNITITLETSIPASATQASCQITAAKGGTTHTLLQNPPFPAEIINSNTINCYNVPPVTSPAPGNLIVTFSNSNSTVVSASTHISIFTAIEFAVSKRPYIYETSGELLLSLDSNYFADNETFSIVASLPAAGKKAIWKWNQISFDTTTTSSNNEIILPLSFDVLPSNTKAIHNDLSLVVTRNQDNTVYVMHRRFHRVPKPIDTKVQVVQVDHSTKGLIINGTVWSGQGWYMQTMAEQVGGWTALAKQIQEQLIPMGVNVGMPYGLDMQPLEVQTKFLDACNAVNFKIMYPLGTGTIKINHGGPFNDTTALQDLISNVTFVQNHPALLGYYICDDCCSNNANVSLQSQVYQLLKTLDPYHVTIGAVNCGNSWMFTDQTPSFLPPEGGDQILSMSTIPEQTQPRLQLSLDVIMQENYATTLVQHGGFGDWKSNTGVGSDGFYRHGVSFEPLMNCPGSWNTNHYKDSHFLLSAQFLGLITADMHDGLTFILENITDWENAIQIGLFAKRVNIMTDGLRAPFGSVIHPKVTSILSPDVRARAWSVPSNKGLNSSSCVGYVIAVNVNETETISFSIELSNGVASSSPLSLLPVTASRMFESMGSVMIGMDGLLKDEIGPGATNCYCLTKI